MGARAGLVAEAIRERAVLAQPAVIGRLVESAGAGPVGRWDRANVLRAYSPGGGGWGAGGPAGRGRGSRVGQSGRSWTGHELAHGLGGEVAATLAFENMAGLPWSVAHLRRSGDPLQWTRRGADVAESWTFPEAANDGRFAVEVDEGSGFEGRFAVAVPEATLPGGATATRVAEIGADGRTGPWVSIGPGTP